MGYTKFFLAISLIISLRGLSQSSLIELKSLADKQLQDKFSRRIFKEVVCDRYMVVGKSVGEGHGGNCESNVEISFKSANYVLIFYSLYSRDLDYTFSFHVVIDSNLVASLPIGEFENIPPCVRKGKECKFVSKSKAISIAKNDSIMFSYNLTVSLRTLSNSKISFWEVSGQDKSNVDYNNPEPIEGWQIFPLRKENTRYVNAKTGELLRFEDFQIISNLNKQTN